jgi:hypothetical protein
MISITFDPSSIQRAFTNMARQIPTATSMALNSTARVVEKELKKTMYSIFDRPTPFVMDSLRTILSSEQNLQAKVWFKNPPNMWDKEHYLAPQVYGGSRPFKRFEHLLQTNAHVSKSLPRGWFAVPGPAARMDAYGNMSRGQLVQLLSAMKAFSESGYRMNRRDKGMGGRARNNLQYVVIQPGRGSKLKPGVWLRGPNNSLSQVLAFVPSVSYRKRLSFFEIAQRVMEREMPGQFDRAMQKVIATAK